MLKIRSLYLVLTFISKAFSAEGNTVIKKILTIILERFMKTKLKSLVSKEEEIEVVKLKNIKKICDEFSVDFIDNDINKIKDVFCDLKMIFKRFEESAFKYLEVREQTKKSSAGKTESLLNFTSPGKILNTISKNISKSFFNNLIDEKIKENDEFFKICQKFEGKLRSKIKKLETNKKGSKSFVDNYEINMLKILTDKITEMKNNFHMLISEYQYFKLEDDE